MRRIINCRFKFFNSKEGFTLIELLVVIAIIGILSALLVSNFIGIRQRARDAQRKSDLRQIQSALELYRSDQGIYPGSVTCPGSLTGGSPSVTYMTKVPCDPQNTTTSYSYSAAGGGVTYNLIACLENLADQQKDTTNNSGVCGTAKRSFTVTQP